MVSKLNDILVVAMIDALMSCTSFVLGLKLTGGWRNSVKAGNMLLVP
jgi:hypothetical protein